MKLLRDQRRCRANDPAGAARAASGSWRTALAGLLVAATALPALAADQVEIGRRIYVEGIVASGAPLVGERFDSKEPVAGAMGACVTCHRPSGMGSVEGTLLASPINGTYLYNLSQKARANMDPHVGKLLSQAHPAYTDEALAIAIRSGVNNSGREMSAAMPHYRLGDADMQALTAYLKQLSARWSPGVTAARIRLATVITPGVAAERRKVFLDMMRTAVTQKNGSTLQGKRHMTSAAEMLLRTERQWDLDVWELQGAADTWAGQLEAHYRKQPPFAIVSGLAEGTWQPVHDFCERQQLPCWFPSVDLPPGQGFYSLYFSRGVALEADLLAHYLRVEKGRPAKRLLQVFHDDAVGRGAAQALARAMEGSGVELEQRPLGAATAEALRVAVQGATATDLLMLWLRPADLAALAEVAPPAAAGLFFSAGLAGGESGLPASWKPAARLVYPYEVPDNRSFNLAYMHAWLKSRGIPLVDEAMQSQVYFALSFLTDSFSDMLDNFYRDYLIERAENMIGRREASRAEEEANVRPHLGFRAPYAGNRPANAPVPDKTQPASVAVIGHAQSTTVYPRLALGPGQRFASKGGYIVRFAGDSHRKLVAESEWIVP